ncbi:hypothetical protein [Duganella sp. FT27W]|uniref:hypothetical protein n=1 Tax=Duganella sp. FT27W TaxID=2654636 RepID=UPI00128C44FD|nr:hypothetical protein [Duganella sp. FT27W]MPQ57485.1 hypothetical protein [Duganella sp. FT27W]
MELLIPERDAIVGAATAFDQQGFDTFLLKNALMPIATFSSSVNAMPLITFEFIRWLQQNTQYLVPAINALINEFPARSETPILKQTVERLTSAQPAVAAGPPWNDSLIERKPIVNRSILRRKLSDICAGLLTGVTLIDGPRRTGRSHSWLLISHVARKTQGWRPVLIDLDSYAMRLQNLPFIAQVLADRLGLGQLKTTSIGCTPETLAARYADEITTAWELKQNRGKIYLVFDSIDKEEVAPEIKHFIRAMAEKRIRHELSNCEIFLLGANLNWGIVDDHRVIDVETLSEFLHQEVYHTANEINNLGTDPLNAADLRSRINDMVNAVAGKSPGDACFLIGQAITNLRIDIKA